MSVVLDSGALVALERDERAMWTRLKAAQKAGELPVTHAGVLGQVWRVDHVRLACPKLSQGSTSGRSTSRSAGQQGSCSRRQVSPTSSTRVSRYSQATGTKS